MPARWVDIQVDDKSMDGYLTQPEEPGPHPAVMVIQEIWGVNSHIQSVTDRFPSQGYVGLAPAMYHREGPMTTGLHEEFPTALDRVSRCTDDNILSDVKSALAFLQEQPFVLSDRIGIVGFCFGGRVSYLAAGSISDIKATVVFYGGLILQPLGRSGPSPLELTSDITSPLLGLFGQEDQNPTPEDVGMIESELQKHGIAHEFHLYPDADHGFHCDTRPSYRPEAAKDAWQKTMAWFDTYLK